MTETAVENNLCAGCDADIRPEALFCYNCGDAVVAETNTNQTEAGISDAWFREEIAENEESESIDKAEAEIKKPDDIKGLESAVKSDAKESPKLKSKTKIRRKPKMKSAATLRKTGPKSLPRKNVEVFWEEKENSPNLWFILASVVIVGVAAVLFYFARVLQ